MEELALHILDIVFNSIKAKATRIQIEVIVSDKENRITIVVKDNGVGMKEEMLSKVTDPFFTTRTTRKVGLGIPLLKQTALDTGGTFEIHSKLCVGTTIKATFTKNHFDTPPLGNLQETLVCVIQAAPQIDYVFTYQDDEHTFCLNTKEMKEVLEDVPINHVDVLLYIKEYVKKGIENEVD